LSKITDSELSAIPVVHGGFTHGSGREFFIGFNAHGARAEPRCRVDHTPVATP
jgi:hypothetical protein